MEIIKQEQIKDKIFDLRGKQIILDMDIAKLYQVETKYLKRVVKRNIERFNEDDFMFQLTKEELENLRCQFVTSSWGGARYLPYAFTEQGIYMLSSILNSDIAINISKTIMRTFTKMRELSSSHKDILIKLQEMEKTLQSNQNQTDENTKHIKTAFDILSEILEDTTKTDKNLIGFAR